MSPLPHHKGYMSQTNPSNLIATWHPLHASKLDLIVIARRAGYCGIGRVFEHCAPFYARFARMLEPHVVAGLPI